jgi:SHS2 domain-containing protein
MFELFDHTADLGLRVRGATLEALLADAGRGLLAMHVADPASVQPVATRTIEIPASEPAYLLFDWLSELLYMFESEKLLLAEFEIEIKHGTTAEEATSVSLRATCRGEIMDPNRHVMDHEVKAITYHALKLRREPEGTWLAEVIVDI